VQPKQQPTEGALTSAPPAPFIDNNAISNLSCLFLWLGTVSRSGKELWPKLILVRLRYVCEGGTSCKLTFFHLGVVTGKRREFLLRLRRRRGCGVVT